MSYIDIWGGWGLRDIFSHKLCETYLEVNVVLGDMGERITGSLIGSNVRIKRRDKRPRGIRFVAGEHTVIEW